MITELTLGWTEDRYTTQILFPPHLLEDTPVLNHFLATSIPLLAERLQALIPDGTMTWRVIPRVQDGLEFRALVAEIER